MDCSIMPGCISQVHALTPTCHLLPVYLESFSRGLATVSRGLGGGAGEELCVSATRPERMGGVGEGARGGDAEWKSVLVEQEAESLRAWHCQPQAELRLTGAHSTPKLSSRHSHAFFAARRLPVRHMQHRDKSSSSFKGVRPRHQGDHRARSLLSPTPSSPSLCLPSQPHLFWG
eukprot:3139974-Rhodomonas_salina.2